MSKNFKTVKSITTICDIDLNFCQIDDLDNLDVHNFDKPTIFSQSDIHDGR